MDNQLIFIIIILVIFIWICKDLTHMERFQSESIYPFNIKYPSNIIDCDIYNNKNDCENGYKCNWITENLKAYPLNTPFCSGNILDVPT